MLNEDQLNENIIAALGIESLPDDKKIEMIEKMSELVQKRIVLNILKQLDDDEKEKFVEATSNKQDEEVKEMLDKHGIDMLQVIQEETSNLKQELKDNISTSDV